MTSRWPAVLGLLLFATAPAFAQGSAVIPAGLRATEVGYLVSDALPAANAHVAAIRYQPQPGDIVLYDDFNKLHHLLFKLANTGGPTHVAMVIARPDGTPALLDLTGPKVITAKVCIIDIDKRFEAFPGLIMVRRLRAPLTAEQSQELTQFAQAQNGKAFALPRIVMQATPFCPRRRELFGHTYLDRKRWFCSELVVAGCAKARLIDGKMCRGNATYPRDLAYDEFIDLSAVYYPPVRWAAAEPR